MLFDTGKGCDGKGADRRIAQQSFFETSDLVTFGPAIEIEIGFALFDGHAHAESLALDGRDADDANVQGMLVDLVDGQDHGRAWFIELDDVDFASSRIPA